MEEKVKEKGWSQWRPNPATGLLTQLVESLVRKWQAVVLYGLDWERGTEEAVIQIPGVEPEEVAEDLVLIEKEFERIGVTATIVAIEGPMIPVKPRRRREAYSGPVARARRLLEKYKRKGGGVVAVEDMIVYKASR